jgi:membrane fusion protein (multidrug efflux system)
MNEHDECPPPLKEHAHGKVRHPVLAIMLPLTLIAVAILAVFITGSLLKAKQNTKLELTPTPPPPRNVAIEEVAFVKELPDTIILPATVEAQSVVEVAAEVSGRVTKTPCVQGSRCKAGDLLVALDSDLLTASYERAKAQADFDVSDHGRMVKLEKGGAATEKQVDEMESRMKISAAAMKLAKARLDRANITSPISGILDNVPVDIGEYLQPGMVVARIVNMDTVKVVVRIPEPDIHFFKKGDVVLVQFRNTTGMAKRRGKIKYISELADTRTRTTRVEIAIDNKDRALRSGQIVRATLTRQVLKNVIMVPLLAIIPLEKGYRVYVVEKSIDGSGAQTVAKMRNITTSRLMRKGPLGIDRIQVLSGLKPGDKLIVQGHRLVGDDQAVSVRDGGVDAISGNQTKGKLGG